jgi:hypothetical protein
MPQRLTVDRLAVAYTAPPSGNVKVEMLRLFKYMATTPNRPRVAPNSHSATSGPLHNEAMFVGLDVWAISQGLTKRMDKQVNAHEVTHALYDLREQGLVRFHPTKNKALVRKLQANAPRGMATPLGGVPVRIQLTKQGLERADYSESLPHLTPDDMLPPGPAPNGPGHISDVEGGIPVTDAQENVTAILPEIQPPVEHAPKQGGYVNLSLYPDIQRLVNAERHVRAAAEALRKAGQPELATMAEETLKERTALEAQVITLVGDMLVRGFMVDDEGGDA